MINFTIIECDQDLMQALVNCGASALMNSSFKLKCFPIGICLLAGENGKEMQLDPTLKTITKMRQDYSHKLFAVIDVFKEEFIYS